jgi:hypothetical protein
MDDPDVVVQRQVEAYNDHDLDAFLACYDDATVIRDGEGRVVMAGREQLRERYGALFAAHPDMHADIESRMVAGEWVVDQEHVRAETREVRAIVAYRVHDGRIRSVVMLGVPES